VVGGDGTSFQPSGIGGKAGAAAAGGPFGTPRMLSVTPVMILPSAPGSNGTVSACVATLNYRRQGYSFAAIAAQMRISTTCEWAPQ
jgi:hypothetical protein